MLKKIILLIIIGTISWYVYNNYMKSEIDQAINTTEKVVEDLENVVDGM
jgi:hypothetical protein